MKNFLVSIYYLENLNFFIILFKILYLLNFKSIKRFFIYYELLTKINHLYLLNFYKLNINNLIISKIKNTQ